MEFSNQYKLMEEYISKLQNEIYFGIENQDEVKFLYNYLPKAGSPQEEMIKLYQPKGWIL